MRGLKAAYEAAERYAAQLSADYARRYAAAQRVVTAIGFELVQRGEGGFFRAELERALLEE
jgi:hypothetical protein